MRWIRILCATLGCIGIVGWIGMVLAAFLGYVKVGALVAGALVAFVVWGAISAAMDRP